jgi:hypothetical protein
MWWNWAEELAISANSGDVLENISAMVDTHGAVRLNKSWLSSCKQTV